MSHDIKSSKKHSIIDIQVVLHSTNPNEIADGLNEFLRPEVGEGWIADYALLNADHPTVVTATDSPEEGELFDMINRYLVCIKDSEGYEDWTQVETKLDLTSMDQDKLRFILSEKLVIGQDDKVSVVVAKDMERITLTAEDSLSAYCVSVYEDKGDKGRLDFFCLADDECHAEEQALDAYQNGEVSHIAAVSRKDYPYKIN